MGGILLSVGRRYRGPFESAQRPTLREGREGGRPEGAHRQLLTYLTGPKNHLNNPKPSGNQVATKWQPRWFFLRAGGQGREWRLSLRLSAQERGPGQRPRGLFLVFRPGGTHFLLKMASSKLAWGDVP